MPNHFPATGRLTPSAMCHIMCHMKTATIRQVRHDFSTVLKWVADGEEVTVLNRTRPVARICPPRVQASAKKFKMPDFAARSRAILGDKVIPNIVLEEREASRW
jgi:antitoxin (DNA-binding transcriptional repressor) of toxin-antitoxin stability system